MQARTGRGGQSREARGRYTPEEDDLMWVWGEKQMPNHARRSWRVLESHLARRRREREPEAGRACCYEEAQNNGSDRGT